MDEIQTETFRLDEWPMIFPGDDCGLYSGTYSVVDGSQAIVVEQGIDRWTRARLGLPLAIDALTSGNAS
jgi:hypothetical protein